MGDALVSRGRQANPLLTYETALRRFFVYGDYASRRWGKPMGGGRCGEGTVGGVGGR